METMFEATSARFFQLIDLAEGSVGAEYGEKYRVGTLVVSRGRIGLATPSKSIVPASRMASRKHFRLASRPHISRPAIARRPGEVAFQRNEARNRVGVILHQRGPVFGNHGDVGIFRRRDNLRDVHSIAVRAELPRQRAAAHERDAMSTGAISSRRAVIVLATGA